TMIELMVAIVVFALGLVAAYSLLRTATFLSERSRDEIVGGNLLRERLELVKNVRDSNWMAVRSWDSLRSGVTVTTDDPSFCASPDNCRLTPGTYVVENDFLNAASPVRVHRVNAAPTKADIVAETNAASGTKFRLCLDAQGRYVHDCSGSNAKTPYFAYVTVSGLSADQAGGGGAASVSGALAVSAHFVSVASGYRELSMNTVITDWKR
ncbi:MAG: prepilin-type N-terminal cleavage/methylation domain-containing protein, partial [Patescibacteria group bacterium]